MIREILKEIEPTMASHPNVSATRFPKQGRLLRQRVEVRFGADRTPCFGVIVRDDDEEPFMTIIQLDDGRFVTQRECMYGLSTRT